MSCCRKCGNTMKETDKFCSVCGSKVDVPTPASEETDAFEYTKRKQEYAGKIIRAIPHKCHNSHYTIGSE